VRLRLDVLGVGEREGVVLPAEKTKERGGASMKAVVDQDTCTGCELCIETCPEIFEMENDTAGVKVDVVPSESEETCRQAAEECPVEAITIEE
jgi:ferredoxin